MRRDETEAEKLASFLAKTDDSDANIRHTCGSDPEGYCVACDLGYD